MKKTLWLTVFAAASLAACAPLEPPTPPPVPPPPPIVVQPPVTTDPHTGAISMPADADVLLDAPKAGPVALDLRAADKGRTFTLHVGDHISVSLVGTPTAGYQWAAPNLPPFLKLDGVTTGATHTDQLKPGFTGGDHWEVTVFTATAPGRGELKLEKNRPWETNEPPVDTWSATIDVR